MMKARRLSFLQQNTVNCMYSNTCSVQPMPTSCTETLPFALFSTQLREKTAHQLDQTPFAFILGFAKKLSFHSTQSQSGWLHRYSKTFVAVGTFTA